MDAYLLCSELGRCWPFFGWFTCQCSHFIKEATQIFFLAQFFYCPSHNAFQTCSKRSYRILVTDGSSSRNHDTGECRRRGTTIKSEDSTPKRLHSPAPTPSLSAENGGSLNQYQRPSDCLTKKQKQSMVPSVFNVHVDWPSLSG